jgi:hypothetical protein
MDNKDVTWNSTTSAWTYSPVKFWPGIVSGGDYGHVTFFALGGLLSGVPAIAYTGTDKAPKFVHTTDPVAANQVDLVAAVNFDEYWVANKTVNFQFKHILSKIGFQAKLADNYSTLYGATVMVKVTSLKVKYANNAVIKGADYHFNTDSDTPTTPGNWQTAGTTKFTDNANSGELIPEDLVSANDGVEVTSTSTAVPLNEADKYLMLIPQTTGADGDLTVELEYQVTTDKDTAAEKTETYKGSYAIPARPYAIGTAYTYTFNIELRAVVFVVLDGEVGVSSWGNPETVDQPADIPVQ